MTNKCKHIYGYSEGVDEGWLVMDVDELERDRGYSFLEVEFNFCPLCGEKLND